MVSDLSKAILFIIKRGASSIEEVSDLLSNDYDEKQVRNRIYSLKYNHFLTIAKGNELIVTPKALLTLEELEFKSLTSNRSWDRKWRVVLYDIPESKRSARDQIRSLLKNLGFRNLQISVWVHPLPCFKQFQTIRNAYGLKNHLLLLEVDDSEDFQSLKRKFAEQYPQLKIN